ncbi:MAG TPA: SpoIIE family protein phosphatase [Solirubrobacterales bacterium]|jgi:serine phosphatase RsbU (regulator of sigma subunit)/PAS domain-containing protein|nr:SpoIIE family protein phosphatase [Solirubrobacterales bacterium]
MSDNAAFAGGTARIGFPSPIWSGLIPALVALAGLALLDARAEWVITGFFAVVPFTTALSGNPRVTAVVAVIAVVVAAVSGTWNDNYDTAEYWARFGLGLAASGFSIYIALMIDRSNRTARRLQLLNEVASGAGEKPSLAATLERITELAVPELADMCTIDAVSGGQMERLAVRAAEPRRATVEPHLLAREPTVQAEVAFDRAPDEGPIVNSQVTAYDLEGLAQSEADLEFLRSLDVHSYIAVALQSRGRRIGVLTLIQAWSGRRHDEEDVRFSQVLADRIALTLDNAGLFSDLESVELRMDTVMGVLDEPVTITERGGRLIFANQAAVELADRSSLHELLDPEPAETEFDIYDEEGKLLGRGMLPWQVSELERDQIIRMIHAGHGEESWLRVRSRAMPAVDNRPIYTVSAFEDVTEMKLAEFAQSVFASTGELLSTSTDPQMMLRRLVRLLTPRLADVCAVLVPGAGGTFELAAIADIDAERERLLTAVIGENPLHPEGPGMPEMLESREPIVYAAADPSGWPEAAADLAVGLDALGLGAVMGQPLRNGSRLIGIIGFGNRTDRRAFTALEQRVALQISERIALAIDNARIASERSEIAATLQNGLRPAPLPAIAGWSVSALYSPAGAENRAGGDFYDLHRIEGGWMVVIGDVTGHGARAASLTALARYTLRAASSLTGDPRQALAQLNSALLNRPGTALCSVAAFTLDQPARGKVRVAVAGHPPPLVIHGHETHEVEPAGPILGAFEDTSWEIETLALDPGDQLLVYTDGVVEARGSGGRFGEDRLSRCIGDAEDPEEAIGRIRKELADFAGGDLEDDAAALAVRLDGLGGGPEPDSAAAAEQDATRSAVSAS